MQAGNYAKRNPASCLSGCYFFKQHKIKRIVIITGLQIIWMLPSKETKVERKINK